MISLNIEINLTKNVIYEITKSFKNDVHKALLYGTLKWILKLRLYQVWIWKGKLFASPAVKEHQW